MCAIAGIFSPVRHSQPSRASVMAMAGAMRHRGPDGEGFHAESYIALAHRRLAIVDLAGGAQPMSTEDGGVVVTFNGEIYNHQQLRTALERLGHRFRTRSDTEVLLHGWRAWGENLLQRLTGMFAFALWDREARTLMLARDPLGEKPLHYSWLTDGTLAFASEIGGLLALPSCDRALDPRSIDDYLALGYVPDPATIYAGIRRLPPAHSMTFTAGPDGRLGHAARNVAPRRYWSPPRGGGAPPTLATEDLHRRLDSAVRARLMSDVPVGSFLSGGIDSGVVTALAALARDTPLATFTIGFPGGADERPDAALVAQRYGTRHLAADGEADYLAAARAIPGIFGEPFGDHSAVPTLAVCRLARREATVALSGDGGDEVFAGYRRYRYHLLAEGVRRILPAGLRRHAVGTLARAYPKLGRAPRWLRAKTTLTEISLDSAIGYYGTVTRIDEDRRRAMFTPGLRAELDGHDPSGRFERLMAECDPADPLLQAQYTDLHTYLPGDILTKVDRTSMAVSLEVRPPLLDPDLVAWGMALPAAMKITGSTGKQILREVAGKLLPREITTQRKRGFAADIAGQLRSGADEVRERLLGPAMLDSGLFVRGPLMALVEQHASGGSDHSQALWQLLVMEGFLHGMDATNLAASAPVMQPA